MVFSRMATSIFSPNAREQIGSWQIISHAEVGDTTQNYVFLLEFLQIIDLTLPKWRQLKNGVSICLWDKLYKNLARQQLKGWQSSVGCWIIKGASLK